jgi:hypothetical protein
MKELDVKGYQILKLALIHMISVSLIAACATHQRMDYKDLNYMKIDCKNKATQEQFSKTQLTTPNERFIAALGQTSVTGSLWQMMNGTYEDNKRIMKRKYDAAAESLLWELRTSC